MSVKVHEAICMDSAQVRFWWMDHFLGDQVKDEWQVAGTGTGVVIDAQTGGIIRLTTGALTNNAMALDWANIRSLHVSKKVTMETRLKLESTVTKLIIALHFDDNNRILFRQDNGTANWRIWCYNGGAWTSGDSGVAVDANYHVFRFECFPTDEVHFYIDGTEVANSPITTTIPDDAADYLQPKIEIQTKEDVAHSADIDYVAIRQER